MKEHLKHSIRSVAPYTVENRFKNLKCFFRAAADMNVDLSTADSLDAQLLKRVRSRLAEHNAVATVTGALHAFRFWYLWSADADLPGFDFEVSVGLENLTIGGGDEGRSSLTQRSQAGAASSFRV